jgi:hypothetical protein
LIPSSSPKKTKSNAQNNPQLQTFAFCDIFVGVQSICALIVIMKAIGFVLDHLHGIGDLKTFTNGRTIPKVKTTTCF